MSFLPVLPSLSCSQIPVLPSLLKQTGKITLAHWILIYLIYLESQDLLSGVTYPLLLSLCPVRLEL